MKVYCDTSGLYALLDADTNEHPQAVTIWERLRAERHDLVCANYVLVECLALIQRRLGLPAVQDFQAAIVPLLEIEWIDAAAHERIVQALLTAHSRQLSLVDCASFDVMRRRGIKAAFAFDRHFGEQGFDALD